MHTEGYRTSRGFTLIETLIGLAVFAIVTTGIFIGYQSVLDIIQSSQYNSAALSIIESHVELIRNMRYEDVGTVGGIPSGKIPPVQDVTLDEVPYELHTYIRNVDDPFDGTLGGNPADLDPADYKLVEFQIVCDACARYDLVKLTTYIAPKNLESASKAGNLIISVFDADGFPVSGATVHVTNPYAVPAVNETDVTNLNGQLTFIGVATGSAAYHITVSKLNYSSDQTYPPGNPVNPVKPDATVATQQLTQVSLAIDKTSSLTVAAHDAYCVAPPSMDFLLTGSTLIGTEPSVPRYSENKTIGVSGSLLIDPLAWDAYTFQPTDTVYDIAGVAVDPQIVIDPDTDVSVTWFVAPRSQSGLSVSVTNAAGAPVDGATVTVTGTGYDETRIGGQWTFTETTWADHAYTEHSADLVADDTLTVADVGGVYATASQWLISETLDFGTSNATPRTLRWTATEPTNTDVRFQLAANNDNATWDFIGPDGTSNSSFTTSDATIPASLSGKRYLRYQAFLETTDSSTTPSLSDVTLDFSSGCLVPGQAYFNGLQSATYTVTVTAAGYQQAVQDVIMSGTWKRVAIPLPSQ